MSAWFGSIAGVLGLLGALGLIAWKCPFIFTAPLALLARCCCGGASGTASGGVALRTDRVADGRARSANASGTRSSASGRSDDSSSRHQRPRRGRNRQDATGSHHGRRSSIGSSVVAFPDPRAARPSWLSELVAAISSASVAAELEPRDRRLPNDHWPRCADITAARYGGSANRATAIDSGSARGHGTASGMPPSVPPHQRNKNADNRVARHEEPKNRITGREAGIMSDPAISACRQAYKSPLWEPRWLKAADSESRRESMDSRTDAPDTERGFDPR